MKLSVLNLVPVREGSDYAQAFEQMVRLAQHVEGLGYERYWIAEHHNAQYLASSATQLLIERTLAGTERIRVGSGGVMLPNHSPYIVAEQYGTLDVMFPGRVDLGLGRAPGTDQATAWALRRGLMGREFQFGNEIAELQGYFAGDQSVSAFPAQGREVPLYVLGSSTDSAHLAASLGLPYAFASHFAPAQMVDAVEIYRSEFRPSAACEQPYVILGANAVLAESDLAAESLFTSQVMQFYGIVSGLRAPLRPPVATVDEVWQMAQAEAEKALAQQAAMEGKPLHFGPVRLAGQRTVQQQRRMAESMLAVTIRGSVETAISQLRALKEKVHFDELMAVSYIFDEAAQHRSYELLAQAARAV